MSAEMGQTIAATLLQPEDTMNTDAEEEVEEGWSHLPLGSGAERLEVSRSLLGDGEGKQK